MAKEFSIKIKVDGQEIDVAKKTTKELNDQISDLRTKLEGVPLGSKDWKKINGDINALEGGFQKAKSAQQDFLTNMSELPGIAGVVGQSMKGVKGAFDLLASNPLVAVFSILAGIMLKVIDKLKEMDGVMEPLNKITSIFSGLVSKLADVILPVVAGAIELVATGVEKLANLFVNASGAGKGYGDVLGDIADRTNDLEDAQAEYELSLAKSNRQLAEAREIAGDTTKSIKERKQAVLDASKIEQATAKEGKRIALEKARLMAQQMAVDMGLTTQEISNLKRADAARLESFVKQQLQNKALNGEKKDALLQQLAQLEQIDQTSAQIGRKTTNTLKSLDKEAAASNKEAADKKIQANKDANEKTKDFLSRLATFENDTRLNNIKDEQEKARVSLEIEKDKALKEIDTLDMTNKRKKKLREAALADFASKEKVLIDKQNEENLKKTQTYNDKVIQLQIDTYSDELQRQKLSIDLKAQQDKRAMMEDTEFKKQSKTEQARILAAIDKKAEVDKKKADEDNAKKNAELVYKQIEFERQSREMAIQTRLQAIDNETKSEIEKIGERRKLLDEQAKIDLDKEVENLQKLLTAKEITEEDFLKRKAELEDRYNVTIAKNAIDTDKKILDARKANIAAVNELGNSIGQLAQAMGAETAEGKALIKVQQALALAATAASLALAFQGLGKDLAKGFPTNIIAVASTLALIATAVSQFKALTGSSAGGAAGAAAPGNSAQNLGRNYADGGLIGGQRHAQGGTLIEAEKGEAIMTRGAVTAFGPILSMLNQAGGGTAFSPNAMVSSYDKPKTEEIQSPIIKTYVVSSDMTSSQEKQARLKELSVL